MSTKCPNCRQGEVTPFFQTPDVPIHSVLLLKDKEEAKAFPRGGMKLGVCESCGFIHNMAFDEAQMSYDLGYESTQAYSSTFRAFQEGVVDRLMTSHQLAGRRAIEVGCAQGEFLELLRLKGIGSAIGFDPAHDPDRPAYTPSGTVRVVREYFDAAQTPHSADVLACLMTIEHVPQTAEFASDIVAAIDKEANPLVYLQAPNAEKILDDGAFWDVYYEHCSYFTKPSLGALLSSAGLEVTAMRTEYDNQYLAAEARVSDAPSETAPDHSGVKHILEKVHVFSERMQRARRYWRTFLKEASARGERSVLWGGGSKAVAFLTMLGEPDEISHAVDINPVKAGTFLPGSGAEVILPDALTSLQIDHVIIMNPIYFDEIQDNLHALGLAPKLHRITDTEPVSEAML